MMTIAHDEEIRNRARKVRDANFLRMTEPHADCIRNTQSKFAPIPRDAIIYSYV